MKPAVEESKDPRMNMAYDLPYMIFFKPDLYYSSNEVLGTGTDYIRIIELSSEKYLLLIKIVKI